MRIEARICGKRRNHSAWMGWVALYCALVIISSFTH